MLESFGHVMVPVSPPIRHVTDLVLQEEWPLMVNVLIHMICAMMNLNVPLTLIVRKELLVCSN